MTSFPWLTNPIATEVDGAKLYLQEKLPEACWYDYVLQTKDQQYVLDISESRFSFELRSIVSAQVGKGNGIGKQIIRLLKDYADATNKSFQVVEIENQRFFLGFDFWTEVFYEDEDGVGEVAYFPDQSL